MKVICGILSVLGLYWAWTALGIYVMLAQIVFEEDDRRFSWAAYVVMGSVLATLGYWLWTGWIMRFLKGRYHWVSARTFWTISIFQHASWFLWLQMESGPGLSWDWAQLFIWWNVSLIAVSLIGLISESGQPSPSKIPAEQDAPYNGG
jgi:hypothetical protein